MRVIRLVHLGLAHHWRTQLAVAFSAAAGTAVLTGALLVGDSVRGSLRDLALERLGRVEVALMPGRFFRENLAGDLAARAAESGLEACPVIVARGSLSRPDSGTQAARVAVLGVSQDFWALARGRAEERPAGRRSVVLNASLSADLGARVGDEVVVRVEKSDAIPREAVLGERGETVRALRLVVEAVLADQGGGGFSLQSSQRGPRNAFLRMEVLQEALGQRGRANVLLAARRSRHDAQSPERGGPFSASADDSASGDSFRAAVQELLKASLTLEDFGLFLRDLPAQPTLSLASLESRRLVLEPAVEGTVARISTQPPRAGIRTFPILTYLANEISKASQPAGQGIPYSAVTALDPSAVHAAWDRLLLSDGSVVRRLTADEILLNEWAADDLGVKQGESIRLSFYVLGPGNVLRTQEALFRLGGVVRMERLGADPLLAPEYPGIHAAKTISEWQPPFPVDFSRIRPKDEAYWQEHRALPKAFISLEAGQRLWSSRFGRLTAVRLVGEYGYEEGYWTRAEIESNMLASWRPAAFGFDFQPVRQQALAASQGSTDFGGLFLGFSLFLIVSSALLVGLSFRLGIERRAREIGILLAVGFTPRQVRLLFLAEGAWTMSAGVLAGLAVAIAYAWLMLAGLRTWWVRAVGTPFLQLYVQPSSLAIGLAASAALLLFSVSLTLRRLGQRSVRGLLAGFVQERVREGPAGRRVMTLGGSALILALVIFTACALDLLSDAAGFFAGGALLLSSALAFLWVGLVRRGRDTVSERGAAALFRLGARNAGRHPGRSVLTCGLIACATFILVTVGVHRHDAQDGTPSRSSGDGGFSLVAESDLPIYEDLGSVRGREALGLSEIGEKLKEAKIFGMRLRPGDDVSCLNLYRPKQPRILGVPDALIERGGFAFQAVLPQAETGGNPWRVLASELPDHAVPVFCDASTVQWILHLGLGQDLAVSQEDGGKARLRIAGLLRDSLFQGELLMAESHFLRLFPGQGGHQVFLVESPSEKAAEVARALERSLEDYGFDAVRTADRLEGYRAVEATYLSTFQVLGGLGLVLGTFGLGAALARGVLERRAELAMLRALGFRKLEVAGLVVSENLFLLGLGLFAGLGCAVVAAAPHLWKTGGQIPWGPLGLNLALVVAAGMAACVSAVASTMRAPLLPSLRGEG